MGSNRPSAIEEPSSLRSEGGCHPGAADFLAHTVGGAPAQADNDRSVSPVERSLQYLAGPDGGRNVWGFDGGEAPRRNKAGRQLGHLNQRRCGRLPLRPTTDSSSGLAQRTGNGAGRNTSPVISRGIHQGVQGAVAAVGHWSQHQSGRPARTPSSTPRKRWPESGTEEVAALGI